jgi:NodT family efflux transporter outer membrane factor (OMF) lipoprotein
MVPMFVRQSKKASPWLAGRLIGALACWCLAGCAVGPDYHPIDTKMPDGYDAATSFSETEKPKEDENRPAIDAAKWWEALKDPELNALIDRAIKDNSALEVALDRIQEARTQEAVLLGDALPEVGVGAGAGAGTGSDLTRGRTLSPLTAAEDTGKLQQVTHSAGFDAGWELDLFGKYRREMEAAEYTTEAAIAARNSVLISVIGDVTHAYVDMRALQMRLAVLQKNTEVLHDYLKLTQERFDRGITNELDFALAQRQLSSLEAEKAPLISQIHAAQYVIAVLVGRFPEDLSKELEKPGLMPSLPENIEAGLPLDLLKRRPDIREAERDVAAATASIGVAMADLFPQVSLTGGAGYQGGVGSTMNTPSFIWSVGPSVSWSLLDFGTLDALVDIADLRAKESLAQYKQTVLNAVREVDTSLGSYAAEQDRLRNLGKALAASQRAVNLAVQRYDRGLTDSLNVIDAERQEYALEDDYVVAQQISAEQFVGLYKALGGGWEQYQSFPPIHQPLPAVLAAFARLLSSDEAARGKE